MNTLLALLALATAYGFIISIFWLSEKVSHSATKDLLSDRDKSLEEITLLYHLALDKIKSIEADRDQLAQALKEANLKLQRRGKDGRYIQK
jgi:hypothetical protein